MTIFDDTAHQAAAKKKAKADADAEATLAQKTDAEKEARRIAREEAKALLDEEFPAGDA